MTDNAKKTNGRRSIAEKAETHERILRHASQSFRAQGVSVGIGDMMRSLGLTQGGFYRHFDSKEELFVDAVTLGLNDIADRLERAAESAPKGQELEAIIRTYLSRQHMAHPEEGCAVAAMAQDIARQDIAVRKRIDGALRLYMERMAKFLPGATAEDRRKNFLILFSGMAGAMTLVRTFADAATREEVLRLNTDFYLRAFGSQVNKESSLAR